MTLLGDPAGTALPAREEFQILLEADPAVGREVLVDQVRDVARAGGDPFLLRQRLVALSSSALRWAEQLDAVVLEDNPTDHGPGRRRGVGALRRRLTGAQHATPKPRPPLSDPAESGQVNISRK